MARPTLPADGEQPWGTKLRDAIYNISDRTDAKADLVSGVLPVSQLPPIAITDYLGTSANETAMLAKVGQKGDWTNRTDTTTTWVITGTDPTQLASWTQILGSGGGGGSSTPAANSITSSMIADGTIVNADISGTAAISADKTVDGTVNHVFTAADDTKLGGIALNATANPFAPYYVIWTIGSGWAARPTAAQVPAGLAVFVSTSDPNATAPTDANKQIGDEWKRHPDAA